MTLVADVEDVQRISPAHDEPQRPVGLRVLLAEDNAMNRSLIVKFLKECACKVVSWYGHGATHLHRLWRPWTGVRRCR